MPVLRCAVATAAWFVPAGWFTVPMAVVLLAGVLVAVHHAEVVAQRIGEPHGTLVLAVSITVIEVALIVSLTLSGGLAASALTRDTVFATVMLILNRMVGLCLLAGGSRFGEQSFAQYGVSASLATLATIAELTLVLPNYTLTSPGPSALGSGLQLLVCLVCVHDHRAIATIARRRAHIR